MITLIEENVIRTSQNIDEKGVAIDFDIFNNNMHVVSPSITINELIDLNIEISKYIKKYVAIKRHKI